MMAPTLIRFFLLASLTLAAAGCQRSGEEKGQVIARVGDQVITVSEFEQEMATRSRARPQFFEEAANRRALLQELIRQKLLLAEARDEGIPEEPEFRALVERMMIQRLREKRLDQQLAELTPDDEEVLAYYESNREAFSRPARRQVALIRVDAPSALPPEERASRRASIEAAREAASALPTDTLHFGEVAVEYSDDRSSRYQGGVVGWLIDDPARRYQWPPAVLEAAFALEQPGSLTPVIDAGESFYLVRLAGYEPGRVQPIEQVADGIRHRLTRERSLSLEGELMAEIEGRRDFHIDESALESVEAPAGLIEVPDRRQNPPAMPTDPGADG